MFVIDQSMIVIYGQIVEYPMTMMNDHHHHYNHTHHPIIIIITVNSEPIVLMVCRYNILTNFFF